MNVKINAPFILKIMKTKTNIMVFTITDVLLIMYVVSSLSYGYVWWNCILETWLLNYYFFIICSLFFQKTNDQSTIYLMIQKLTTFWSAWVWSYFLCSSLVQNALEFPDQSKRNFLFCRHILKIFFVKFLSWKHSDVYSLIS